MMKYSEKNCWIEIKTGKCLYEPPEGYYGFTYLIVNEQNGKIYVGKKAFTFNVKKKLSKKARKGTRKRVEVNKKDSGWLSYFGSSNELKEDIKVFGEGCFTRYILDFCKSKTELSYMEVKQQIVYRVLEVPSYNNWISCRVYKRFMN